MRFDRNFGPGNRNSCFNRQATLYNFQGALQSVECPSSVFVSNGKDRMAVLDDPSDVEPLATSPPQMAQDRKYAFFQRTSLGFEFNSRYQL